MAPESCESGPVVDTPEAPCAEPAMYVAPEFAVKLGVGYPSKYGSSP